jgi:methylmalonyl-CoA/ethylmalonyl-CoA epimerase
MPRVHIDHVSMCVWNLETAIADWQDILAVLSPGHGTNLTRGGGTGDGVAMEWATFQNPDPEGVSIQLWAPATPDTWVHKVLAKRGEFVHHIAFLSDDFGHTVEQCRAAGLPVLLEENSGPDSMPWLGWNFIGEEKAHGVLIELATRYQTIGDKWYPHPANAENSGLRQEYEARYYTGG